MIRIKTLKYATFTFVIGCLAIPLASYADGLKLQREVLFEPGAMTESRSIVKTNDDGIIIAGHLQTITNPPDYGRAWAMKTDAEGKLLWRYVTARKDKVSFDLAHSRGQFPEYSSAAAMPDGSVYLCGTMPDEKGSSGLLTHLDKDGHLLSERLIVTDGFKEGSFHSCIASDNGITIAGAAWASQRILKDANTPVTFDAGRNRQTANNPALLWLLHLDETGKTTWSNTLLIKESRHSRGVTQPISPLLSTGDGGFNFTEREINNTVVGHVTADGKISTDLVKGYLFPFFPAVAKKGCSLFPPTCQLRKSH